MARHVWSQGRHAPLPRLVQCALLGVVSGLLCTCAAYTPVQGEGDAPPFPKLDSERLVEIISEKVRARRCDLDRRTGEDLSVSEFRSRYAMKKPVLIMEKKPDERADEGGVGPRPLPVGIVPGRNALFRSKTHPDNLVETFGDMEIVLTDNHYSTKTSTFSEYFAMDLGPQPVNGSTAWYLFGEQQTTREWDQFFRGRGDGKDGWEVTQYAGPDNTLNFGVGGFLTGTPFHHHRGGFSEVMHGSKLWMLYPPGRAVPFVTHWGPWSAGDRLPESHSALEWMLHAYAPTLAHMRDYAPLECVVFPGDILYFPPDWIHAILNTSEINVFITTFTGGEDIDGEGPPGFA